jgi:hypothetical protein
LIDTKDAKADYKKAAPWLKLLNSYADGINYYLYKHPEVQPALLTHFEPWFPTLDRQVLEPLVLQGFLLVNKAFYSGNTDKVAYIEREKDVQTGSNGFQLLHQNSFGQCHVIH